MTRIRAFLALLAAGALLAACGPGAAAKPPPAAASPAADTVTVLNGDYTLGSPAAKVTLIEYGAPTCPYCKMWHDQVYAVLKRDFVDAGKIRFAFRELPSHNPPVDTAIFAIARCAAPNKYFAVLDAAFARQSDIEAASRTPAGPAAALRTLAGEFGIGPMRFGPCLDDPKTATRLALVRQLAARDGVPGTPTLLLDGKVVPDDTMSDAAKLSALLAKAVAAAR